MIISVKEYFSLIRDRDYLSILCFLVFLLSLLGVAFKMLSIRDTGLFAMTFILSRLLFAYRTEVAYDTLSEQLSGIMDKERKRAGFESGNLSLLLEKELPGINKAAKNKYMQELESEMEVELSPAGHYIFYPNKVYKQPGKDRRRRQF